MSWPPLAVPPLSRTWNVKVEVGGEITLAGVNVSWPAESCAAVTNVPALTSAPLSSSCPLGGKVVITTPANVNDTVPADSLIRGDEKAVWADAAYHTHAREARLKARGVKPRLMRRPNKHHPQLPPRLARLNRLISRRRAAVETTFATLKNRMGMTHIRYLGLTTAHAQVTLAAMAFNLRRWVTLSPA